MADPGYSGRDWEAQVASYSNREFGEHMIYGAHLLDLHEGARVADYMASPAGKLSRFLLDILRDNHPDAPLLQGSSFLLIDREPVAASLRASGGLVDLRAAYPQIQFGYAERDVRQGFNGLVFLDGTPIEQGANAAILRYGGKELSGPRIQEEMYRSIRATLYRGGALALWDMYSPDGNLRLNDALTAIHREKQKHEGTRQKDDGVCYIPPNAQVFYELAAAGFTRVQRLTSGLSPVTVKGWEKAGQLKTPEAVQAMINCILQHITDDLAEEAGLRIKMSDDEKTIEDVGISFPIAVYAAETPDVRIF